MRGRISGAESTFPLSTSWRGGQEVRSRRGNPAPISLSSEEDGAGGRFLPGVLRQRTSGPGGLGEDEGPALDGVDHLGSDLLGERRAAQAPADAALGASLLRADVPGAVHDDVARLGEIVEAFVEPAELERVAVATLVGAAGQEQAEAGLVAVRLVREARGVVGAAAAAVRHQLVVEDLAALEIEHP